MVSTSNFKFKNSRQKYAKLIDTKKKRKRNVNSIFSIFLQTQKRKEKFNAIARKNSLENL